MVISVKRTETYSASITVLLWLFVAIAAFFVPITPPSEKPDYPVVNITLSIDSIPRIDSKPVVSEPEPLSQPQPQVQPQAIQTPAQPLVVPPKPVEQKNPTVQSKPPEPQSVPKQSLPTQSQQNEPPKTPVPAVQIEVAPQVLAPDLTTLSMNSIMPSQDVPKKPTEWPSDAEWVTQSSQQAKVPPTEQTTTAVQTPQVPTSASPPDAQFEGTAATAQTADTGVRTASTGRIQTVSDTPASEQTAGTLKRIAEATYLQAGDSSGISYETALQAVSQTVVGSVEIQMRDGSTRRLLDPKEPKIILSPENEKLIDASKRVMVQFRVLAVGTVPLGGISFSPAGLLPVPVQEEVRLQISRWRFETAQSDGQAAFQYSIKKE